MFHTFPLVKKILPSSLSLKKLLRSTVSHLIYAVGFLWHVKLKCHVPPDKPFWRSGERAVDAFAYLTGVTNLTCDADANPPAVYEWFKANKPIVSKTNITIIKETDRSVLQVRRFSLGSL
jgi:hypothetical protein